MVEGHGCYWKGKKARIFVARVTLTDANWLPLELPAHNPLWVFWRIRNLNDASGLDISFERKVPANNPNYFEIDPRGPEGFVEEERVFPDDIRVRRQTAGNQVIYYEYVVLDAGQDEEE